MAVDQGNGEVPVEDNVDSVTEKCGRIMSGSDNSKEKGESVSAPEKGTDLLCMDKIDQISAQETEGTDLVSCPVRVDTLIGNGETVECCGENGEERVDLVPETVGSVGNLLVPSGDKETEDLPELAGCGGDGECANGDADTGTSKNGEGGRARKRRKVESSDKEGNEVDSGDKTKCTGDNENQGHVSLVQEGNEADSGDKTNCTDDNEHQGHVSLVQVPGCAEGSLPSSVDLKMEEKGSEDSDLMALDSVRVKGHIDKPKARSVGRERKRRMGDRSVCNASDSAPVKKFKGKPFDGKSEVIGRILRSRTVLTAAGGGFTGSTGKEEADDYSEEKVQGERNGSAESIGAENKKMKGRRGRPRKTEREVGGEEKKGDDLCDGTVVMERVKGTQLNGMKEKKKKKDGRGRPRKTDRKVGDEEKKGDGLCDGTVVMEKVEGTQLNGMKEKKKKKDGRGRPRKMDREVGVEEKKGDGLCDETVVMKKVVVTQLNGRKEKKKKKGGRGRPRKTDREVGGEEKGDELCDETVMEKVEGNQLNGRKEKKKKKSGRGWQATSQAENSGEGNEGNDDSCKESDGAEKVEVHQTISRRIKKRTGFRGRPPKAQGKVLGEAKKETPGMQISGSTRSSGRVKKKEGSCQERSPKFQVESGRSKVSGCQNQKDLVSKKTGNQSKSAEVIGDSNIPRIEQKKIKRSTEKNLLRERISAMLKAAGWTIDLRPRMGREYLDSVYVSPEGKTHWSVTLAYKVLKQKAEDGDRMAVSAFTPLPDEEFSKLFRVRKQKKLKGQAVGGKKVHAVSQKKSFKIKHAKERKRKNKCKEKLVSSRNKQKPDSHEDGAAKKSRKGMRVPKRGVKPKKKTFALLVRESRKGYDPDSEGFEPCDRKISLLSWMIDLGTITLDEKVLRMKGTSGQGLLEGRITTNGICCYCCKNNFSLSDFEFHAANESNQPFQNIYLESGTSLLQCLLDSWMKYKGSVPMGFHSVDVGDDDPNDDTCNMCGDGGDLICCDGCPSTFHQNCLNIQNFPSGDWHCVYCSCKFCGTIDESSGQRDQNHYIQSSVMLSCRSCEQKYHQSCIPEKSAIHIDASSSSFCGEKCQEVFERLQLLLGVKHELEEGYSWTLIQHSEIGQDISSSSHHNIECNSKLAVAYSIMDECFLPILDERSGITMIRNVVYSCGSNFTRLNYSGFITAILEKGDDMISVASIRIHGNYLAEMPFIGTRHMYRRQGMCRRLLSAIELSLCSLNVEKLVIPAISELEETWTSVFGFLPLEESSKEVMKSMNMVVFPGVAMLQKPILKHKFPEENIILTAATDSCEPEIEQPRIHGTCDLALASDSALHLGRDPTIDAAEIASQIVALQEPKLRENRDHSGVTHGNQECESKDLKSELLSDATTSERKTSHATDSKCGDPVDSEINEEENPAALLTSRVEDRENSLDMSIAGGSNPISVSGDCNDGARLVSEKSCENAGLSYAENTSAMSDVVGPSQTSCSGAGIDNHNPKEDNATGNDFHPPSADSLPNRPQMNTNSPKKSDVDQGISQVPEPLCNSSSSSAISLLCSSASCNPTVTPEVKSSRSLRSGRLC